MPKTPADYRNAIAVCLAGIAAELEVFGSFTDGAAGSDTADLNRATELVTILEGALGMGHTLVVEDQVQLERLRTHSPEFRRSVHAVLEHEVERARSAIRNRRMALDAIVDRLMDVAVMSGDDVFEIMDRHRRPTVSLAKKVAT